MHTAIWKEPVAGNRTVRRLNIDGDGQGDLAGHGGEYRAVDANQIESYRHWQNERGDLTLAEIAQKHGLHPTQIATWRRQLLEHPGEVFANASADHRDAETGF